jgi:hypothetical protein
VTKSLASAGGAVAAGQAPDRHVGPPSEEVSIKGTCLFGNPGWARGAATRERGPSLTAMSARGRSSEQSEVEAILDRSKIPVRKSRSWVVPASTSSTCASTTCPPRYDEVVGEIGQGFGYIFGGLNGDRILVGCVG